MYLITQELSYTCKKILIVFFHMENDARTLVLYITYCCAILTIILKFAIKCEHTCVFQINTYENEGWGL